MKHLLFILVMLFTSVFALEQESRAQNRAQDDIIIGDVNGTYSRYVDGKHNVASRKNRVYFRFCKGFVSLNPNMPEIEFVQDLLWGTKVTMTNVVYNGDHCYCDSIRLVGE